MSEEIYALMAGLKIAIYFAVLVMAFVVDIAEKGRKSVHGLNLMALSFMIIAIVEFMHVFAHLYNDMGLWSWFVEHENLHLIANPLLVVGGIGIILYLRGILRNIKDYY